MLAKLSSTEVPDGGDGTDTQSNTAPTGPRGRVPFSFPELHYAIFSCALLGLMMLDLGCNTLTTPRSTYAPGATSACVDLSAWLQASGAAQRAEACPSRCGPVAAEVLRVTIGDKADGLTREFPLHGAPGSAVTLWTGIPAGFGVPVTADYLDPHQHSLRHLECRVNLVPGRRVPVDRL